MFQVHCHVHESAVLLDWSRIEAAYDTDEGPVLDWHCWCGARGRLIAGTRSEPRSIEPVVIGLDRVDRDDRQSATVTGDSADVVDDAAADANPGADAEVAAGV